MKIAGLANEEGRRIFGARAAAAGVTTAWVDSVDALSEHRDATAYFDLSFEMNAARIEGLGQLLPAPVIINSVIYTLEQIGQPFIRINGWPGFLERGTCEIVFPSGEKRGGERGEEKRVTHVFEKLNWRWLAVADVPGMISARIVAAIINEAYHTLQDGVSTKESIDTAMKLGTSYPYGPFEWASLIGLQPIHSLLGAMEKNETGYEASGLLKEEAFMQMRLKSR